MGALEDEIAKHVSENVKDIARDVSASPQRLRNMIFHRRPAWPPSTTPERLNEQLTAVHEKLTEPDASTATAAPAVTTTTAAMPLPSFLQPKPKVSTTMATTPTSKAPGLKAKMFADRLKEVTSKIDDDLDKGISALEQVHEQAAAVTGALGGIVAQKQADLHALQDVVNQLTNGAPDEPEAETPAPPA